MSVVRSCVERCAADGLEPWRVQKCLAEAAGWDLLDVDWDRSAARVALRLMWLKSAARGSVSLMASDRAAVGQAMVRKIFGGLGVKQADRRGVATVYALAFLYAPEVVWCAAEADLAAVLGESRAAFSLRVVGISKLAGATAPGQKSMEARSVYARVQRDIWKSGKRGSRL